MAAHRQQLLLKGISTCGSIGTEASQGGGQVISNASGRYRHQRAKQKMLCDEITHQPIRETEVAVRQIRSGTSRTSLEDRIYVNLVDGQ